MGSCVSSSFHKKSSSLPVPDPSLNHISIPDHTTSSLKTNVINARVSSGDRDEETMFYDSRCWLDSDCDDEFMSVDGGFTPSRETTPLHPTLCDQTTTPDQSNISRKHEEQEASLSPIDNKKRLLVELFKETQDDVDDEDGVAEGKARACLWLRTPGRSSAPATPYNLVKEKDRFKRVRSTAHGGCVPRLVSCSSFTERRRKMMTH